MGDADSLQGVRPCQARASSSRAACFAREAFPAFASVQLIADEVGEPSSSSSRSAGCGAHATSSGNAKPCRARGLVDRVGVRPCQTPCCHRQTASTWPCNRARSDARLRRNTPATRPGFRPGLCASRRAKGGYLFSRPETFEIAICDLKSAWTQRTALSSSNCSTDPTFTHGPS